MDQYDTDKTLPLKNGVILLLIKKINFKKSSCVTAN